MVTRSIKITAIIIVCLILKVAMAAAAGSIGVYVSIAPQKYFVQQICQDLADVHIMVPPGASPATYEPKPKQMAGLAKAQIYFSIGVPFEQVWLSKISAANPHMRMIATDQGVAKIAMVEHHHDRNGTHHNPHPDHHREGLDPHIWLSPPLVKIQARNIVTALKEVDPSHRMTYDANYHQFVAGLDELDGQVRKMLAGAKGRQFMVFHPSWGYFAQTYGLRQVPIEIAGKRLKPAQLKTLIEHAKTEAIKVIFVQPQFSTKSAQMVAREVGARIAFADPLAQDWPTNLLKAAEQFKTALK